MILKIKLDLESRLFFKLFLKRQKKIVKKPYVSRIKVIKFSLDTLVIREMLKGSKKEKVS